MRVKEFIKGEFSGWGKYERIIFPMEILLIIFISLSIGDNKIALVSAVCGISYTILAGKGKISCYIFGLCGTFCYSYLAYKNALFGNLLLYMLYYFPMQIIGIFKWKKHMKETSHEIIKTSLPQKQKYVYFILTLLVAFAVSQVLRLSGGQAPYMDAFTTVFSVLVCGLMLFNIIAFLMIMVVVIVRLNRDENEPIMSSKMTISLAIIIATFDIILIIAIWTISSNGIVVL